MASFTMVEQITSMTSSNAQIAKTLTTSNAVGLIGRTVTYMDADGETLKTGKVERVSTSADGVSTLTVGGATGIDPIVHHRRRLIRRPTNKEHSLS